MLNDFREVIGAIQSEREFEVAVAELEAGGINRAQISVLAQEQVAISCTKVIGCDITNLPHVEVHLGVDRQQLRTLLTSLAATVASFAGAGAIMAATGGAAAPAILAALASGGSVGGLAALFGQRHEAASHDWAEQQVLKGGILVIVHPANEKQLAIATQILHRLCGKDVVSSLPV